MNCQTCGAEKELLEHHVSYTDKHGLYPIEIIIEVCMDCHHKIHKKEGFHDELNPVELTAESSGEYENLVAGLIQDCESIVSPLEIDSGNTYKIYEKNDKWAIELTD